jgi:CCR4-NOT transcription complex subunit 3
MIEDYVERNQESFDEFADSVTDLYESLNLDALSAAMCVQSRALPPCAQLGPLTRTPLTHRLAGEVSMKRGGRDSDDSASDSGSSDDDEAGSAPVSPAPDTLKSPAAARAAAAPPPSPAAPKAAAPPAVPRPTVAPRPAVAQPGAAHAFDHTPSAQLPDSPSAAFAAAPVASARVLPAAGANGDGGKPGPAEVRPQSWAVPLPMTPQEPVPPQSAPLYAQRSVPPPAVQPQPAADKAQFLSRLQQRVPPAPPPGVPPPGYKQPFGDAAAAAAGMGSAGASRGASGDVALFSGDGALREDGPLASTSADLRRALEGLAGLRDSTPAFDAVTSLRLLESSFASGMPQSGDSQVLRRGRVRTLVPVPPSFPVAPPPVMENPALFERLDLDALFFSFYFQQGTVQQLLAARELKRSNWRFHKKYNTWFARAEEPKLVTDDLEQGAYVYFDFAQDWCVTAPAWSP